MDRYYTELANAFVRGRLGQAEASFEGGVDAGLRLHKFKANSELSRVRRAIGILRGIAPANLLDVGSGRGTFLWPLLASFPELPVTSVDWSERRTVDADAVRKGGIGRLTVARMDAQRPAFRAGAFDVVTILEVLEHMANPQAALDGLCAVARRFVVLSVPSVPDENPEHIHLFSVDQLQAMARRAGAASARVEHVLNHRIALLRVGDEA